MSLEQAKEFIERLKTDEAFKARIMAVEDVAERLKLAKADGYDFTEEEINSASAELVVGGAEDEHDKGKHIDKLSNSWGPPWRI